MNMKNLEEILREKLTDDAVDMITASKKDFSEWLDRILWTNKKCDELAREVEQYRDLEEQGLLLRLPCKVGDTVWELCKCDDGVYRIFPMVVKQVVQCGSIRWVKEKEPTVWNIYATSDYTYMHKSFYDIGKTVFLTQSEAEEKLRELEGK